MNFEDFVKAWQRQRTPQKATLDAEALLGAIRAEQHLTWWRNFLTDMFIVSVEAMCITVFLFFANLLQDWSSYVVAFACFFIGTFILIDRWLLRHRQPINKNDTLASCTRSLLAQKENETWRSKNLFWWFVLPLEIGFTTVGVSLIWRAYARHKGWGEVFLSALGAAGWISFCWLLGWYTCWASKREVEKVSEPRGKELEELLASLNENPSGAGTALQPKEISRMKTSCFYLFLALALILAAMLAFIVYIWLL